MSEFHQNMEHRKGGELLDRNNLLTLFESINDFVFILNKEAKVLDVNPIVLKKLKYSKDELVGNSVLNVHPPDQHEKVIAIIKEMIEGKREICLVPLLTKDGKLIPVETKVTKGVMGDIDVLIGISRDISERKMTENQLERERDIFKSITETSPLGITMVNKYGEISFANPQAELILGLTKDKIIERTYNAPSWKITDFEGNIFPDHQLPFQQVKRLKHPVFDIRHKIEWPNGKKVFLSINAAPLLDKDGNFEGMVATLNNITEKIKIEENLKKEQSRVELYLDLAGVIIVALNKHGEITLMNKKGYEILEYEDGELIGKNWFDVCLPPSYKDQVSEVYNHLMKGEAEPVEFYENPIITKSGKQKIIAWHNRLLFDKSKNIIGTLSSGEDITKRKIVEEELKKNEEFLQNIFDGMQDGISILDKDLNIIRVNYWMQEMYNYEGGLIGQKCYKIYQQREQHCPWCPSIKTLESGLKYTAIVPYPSEDNPVGWIELTSFPLKQQDNKIIGVIEYVKDITERVNANQKLKESEEKYRGAYNRSNLYKDVFTHDINNILQNILSSIELTKLYSSDPKKRQSLEEVINLIYEQVIRGKMLVSNVQELSKTENIIKTLFSIEALKILNESLESVKSQFFQKVIITKIYSQQDEYFVKANELLKDVFINILTNAVQHNNNPFVEISIKISKQKIDDMSFIKFEFLDNGIGIPDSMKELIFNRKYKKEGIPSGIGLGLLLVKKILEIYKGEIRVKDHIEGDFTKGSNFIIKIPEFI